MRTIVAAVFCSVLTLVPSAAHATSLDVTNGVINLTLVGQGYGFTGDDFSVFINSIDGVYTPSAFGVGGFEHHWELGGIDTGGVVRVGSESCFAGSHDGSTYNSCGRVSLQSAALPPVPNDWPRTLPYVATAPFTLSGFLTVGGSRFEVFGGGTLTGINCLGAADCPVALPTPYLRYTFATVTVPESTGPLLTVVFGIAIAAILIVQRRPAASTKG